MGIPRFFKLLSERYTLAVEHSRQRHANEHENLYIDMNGVIHMMTHDNDEGSLYLSREKMLQKICSYVEYIFDTVNPTELLFLAVDGVVCRMKMNQQRSRRFLHVKERRDAKKPGEPGGPAPDPGQRFDPNCISPGTEFMNDVEQEVMKFIGRKRETDPRWRRITVIYSGHRTPEEGEHKIIGYIKATRDTSTHKRHCIHSSDADMILLGLLTSMPYCSILREELNIKNERTGDFLFFHSHIVRDCMFLELGLSPSEESSYHFLDDVILTMSFFGNDFLPGVFDLLDSFDDILWIYKSAWSQRGRRDQLHRKGAIQWKFLLLFLEELAAYERLLFLEKKFGPSPRKPGASFKQALSGYAAEVLGKKNFLSVAEQLVCDSAGYGVPAFVTKRIHDGFQAAQKTRAGSARVTFPDRETLALFASVQQASGKKLEVCGKAAVLTEDAEALFEGLLAARVLESLPGDAKIDAMWEAHKALRYRSKRIEPVEDVVRAYALGLKWVTSYYFEGCPSWGWYYPCHYGVFISDVWRYVRDQLRASPGNFDAEIAKGMGYRMDQPTSTLVQQVSILPSESMALVPAPLREIVSVLPEYFPTDCPADRDGKRAAWESVCILPFVDMERISTEVAKRVGLLSEEEVRRNTLDGLHVWHGLGDLSSQTIEAKAEPCAQDYEHIPFKGGVSGEDLLRAGAQAYLEVAQGIGLRSKPKPIPFVPSLFVKKVRPAMTKIVNGFFSGDRRRLVVNMLPCKHVVMLAPDLLSGNKASLSKALAGLFSGRNTYAGFPYLRKCTVRRIELHERAFESVDGAIKEVAPSAEHAKQMAVICKALFKERSIYIKDRASYALCSLEKTEVLCPLEMLVVNHRINGLAPGLVATLPHEGTPFFNKSLFMKASPPKKAHAHVPRERGEEEGRLALKTKQLPIQEIRHAPGAPSDSGFIRRGALAGRAYSVLSKDKGKITLVTRALQRKSLFDCRPAEERELLSLGEIEGKYGVGSAQFMDEFRKSVLETEDKILYIEDNLANYHANIGEKDLFTRECVDIVINNMSAPGRKVMFISQNISSLLPPRLVQEAISTIRALTAERKSVEGMTPDEMQEVSNASLPAADYLPGDIVWAVGENGKAVAGVVLAKGNSGEIYVYRGAPASPGHGHGSVLLTSAPMCLKPREEAKKTTIALLTTKMETKTITKRTSLA